MNDTVIPFRPRHRLYRAVDCRDGVVGRKSSLHSLPMRIDASVRLTQLMQGLQAAGLACKREEATGVYVIVPK